MDHTSQECNCEGKFCKDCQEIKCLGYMSPQKNNNKTYYYYCKACKNKHKYAWAKANPEKAREANKKWIKANPEKVRERSQKYSHIRTKNAKTWNEANYERVKANKRAWAEANPERNKQMIQEWYKANPGKITEYTQNRRARKEQATGSFTMKEWQHLKAQYNHTCLCCGAKEPDIKLTADHVVPLKNGGNNYISNIQPLCKLCNCKKHTKSTDYRPLYKKDDKC